MEETKDHDSNSMELRESIDNEGEIQAETAETKEIDTSAQKQDIMKNILDTLKVRENYTNINRSLQNRLVAFLKGSAEKDYFQKIDLPEAANENILRDIFDSIQIKQQEIHIVQEEKIKEMQIVGDEIREKEERWLELQKEFSGIKQRIALASVHSETGERLSAEEVNSLLKKEEDVYKTMQEFQLQSIKKRHHLNNAVEKKKNLAQGPLDYAEYEMMCIETENNNEAILQTKEEIKDVVKKSSNMVSILSHLTQKLFLAESQKVEAEVKGKALEDELNQMRNQVFLEKTKYTQMKEQNKELQHKSILLQYPKLIEDYNSIQNENENAKKEIEKLQAIYENAMKLMPKNV